MNKKIVKILVVLIITCSLVYVRIPVAQASLVGNAQAESGHKPPPPTPPDSNTSPSTPPSKPPEITEIVEAEYYCETISGNVYEEIGEIFQERNRRK